jgi:micrococcal nuclease
MLKKLLFIALACCLMPFSASPITGDFTIDGYVVGIVDGDTFDVLVNKQVLRIRMLDIDAPESGQPFGKAAKKLLASLIFNKTVHCVWLEKDRYKRFLATVKCDNKDVCLQMIQQGLAWKYYACNNVGYEQAMQKAKANQLGLWKDKRAIDPHDWRKLSKEQRDLYR